MNEVDFNPKRTMKQTVDLFQQLARAKKIKLSLTISDYVGHMPKYVKGDEKRFRQVLSNLIKNAIKFTSVDGMINVRAKY